MIGEFLSQNLCFLVVYILPAYDTFKFLKSFSPSALHSSNEQQQQILQQSVFWLRYWCIIGIFTVSEYYVSFLLSWIIPFFYEIRVLFCLWLRYSRGAELLYTKQVEPRLTRNEQSIDQRMQNLKRQAFRKFLGLGSSFFVALQRAIAQGLVEGQVMLLQARTRQQQESQSEIRSVQAAEVPRASPVRVTHETNTNTGESTTSVDLSELKIPITRRKRLSMGVSPLPQRLQSPLKITEHVEEQYQAPSQQAIPPFILEEPAEVNYQEVAEAAPVESGLYPSLESFLATETPLPPAEPVMTSKRVVTTPLSTRTTRPSHTVSDKENLGGSRSNDPAQPLRTVNKFSSSVTQKKLTQRTTTKVQKKV